MHVPSKKKKMLWDDRVVLSMKHDAVWYADVRVLSKRPLEFFPARDQTTEEHVNAITRLLAYVSIAVSVYRASVRPLLLGGMGIILVALLYRGRTIVARNGDTARCRGSTKTNPFANMLVTEYGKEMPPPPCAYDDMEKDVKKNFNENLPRNMDDWSERENSQREFITMPNGGRPPDTRAFAEFLYGGMRNCKTKQSQCTGYD
jgi:hypothetical protein